MCLHVSHHQVSVMISMVTRHGVVARLVKTLN